MHSFITVCQFPEETKGKNVYRNELRFVPCYWLFVLLPILYLM